MRKRCGWLQVIFKGNKILKSRGNSQYTVLGKAKTFATQSFFWGKSPTIFDNKCDICAKNPLLVTAGLLQAWLVCFGVCMHAISISRNVEGALRSLCMRTLLTQAVWKMALLLACCPPSLWAVLLVAWCQVPVWYCLLSRRFASRMASGSSA